MLVFSAIPVYGLESSDSQPSYVAEVDGTKYTSLQEAVKEVPDKSTVTVLESHTISCDSAEDVMLLGTKYSTVICVEGKGVTVDLNGKSILCEIQADFSPSTSPGTGLVGFFAVEEGGHLTLKDSSVDQKGTRDVRTNDYPIYASLVCFDGDSTLTVESGNYIQDKGPSGRGMVYIATKETVFIKGGNFTLGNVGQYGASGNFSPWIFNASGNSDGDHANVSGGTFNADINHQHWKFEVEMDPSLALRNNGDGTWTVVPAVAYVLEQAKTDKWYNHPVGYATIEEAITAAQQKSNSTNADAEEIFVIDSIDINGSLTIPEDVVINLDTEGADLNVYGTLINNGNIESSGDDKGHVNLITSIVVDENGQTTTKTGSFDDEKGIASGVIKHVFTTDNETFVLDNAQGKAVAVATKDGEPVSTHTSLKEAYEASGANGILLLKNIEAEGLDITKKSTLDLGGNTYTVTDGSITVGNGGDVTIKNGTLDGDIKVKDGGRLEVQDGIYSADVSSYCAKGYHVRKSADGMYVVESHNLEMTEATEATCTEAGNIAYWYCDVCKAYFGDTDAINKVSEEDLIMPATGHKYIDGKCRCGAEEPKEEPKEEQKPEEPTGEQDDPKNGTEEIIPEESATGKPDADAEKNFEIDEVAGVYVQGSGEPFYLRGNGEFTDFKDVKVDGELVDEQYYSVTEGSTIITFTTAYLDSLEPGKHYAEMIWTTGTAEIEFVIAAAPEKNTEEDKKIDSKGESKGIDTGDMSSLYLWLVTAFVASVTLMFTYCIWRKRVIK